MESEVSFQDFHRAKVQAGSLILNKHSPLQARLNESEAVIALKNKSRLLEPKRSGMIIGGVAIGFNAIKSWRRGQEA